MTFSSKSASRAVNFVERMLRHTNAEWAGLPFILAKWQRDDILKPLFGTLRPDGLRQYRTAYISLARKNGKSELAAAIALYLLFADDEPGAEIYGAASDRDQASIVFNLAAGMVRASPELSQLSRVIDSQKRIVVPSTSSVYRAIPADVAGSHGFNASGIVFDELHAQPNRELWDVLATSSGARRQPLTLTITTAGYDRNSICYELYTHARQVSEGIIEDPSFFAYLREVPEEADWQDEALWPLANPALGDFRKWDEMRAAAHRAELTPGYENTFRRLYLNQWVQQEIRWMSMAAWDECALQVDLSVLEGRRCYAGLDLASTTDIAALVLVFPDDADLPGFDVLAYFWVPGDNILDRVRRDKVPYDLWARQGLIMATEGNVIDYEAIAGKLDELAQVFDIQEVAYDRWGATQLVQGLQAAGMNVIPFGQGMASMSPPTKELLNMVLSKRIRHGGHPVLRWMADNVTVRQDAAGNQKPDKAKSTGRIDGIVALIMGLDRATRAEPEVDGSVYDERGDEPLLVF